jgi:stage V sporulation protein AE
MIFLYAFLVGGFICMLAQFILDLFELTPGVITAIFVSLGALLEFFDIYDKLVKFSGAGALIPITSFGHSLADAAYKKAVETNYLGVLSGMLTNVSTGIVIAVVLSVCGAIIFKPRD